VHRRLRWGRSAGRGLSSQVRAAPATSPGPGFPVPVRAPSRMP